MNDNIKAGAEIMGGDGEYCEGTKEGYEAFVKERNKSLGTARIKELSDIAYKNHLARNPNSSFGRRSDYDKEFAELIIRECAGICFSEAKGHNMAFGEHCGIIIKEHFGVDE